MPRRKPSNRTGIKQVSSASSSHKNSLPYSYPSSQSSICSSSSSTPSPSSTSFSHSKRFKSNHTISNLFSKASSSSTKSDKKPIISVEKMSPFPGADLNVVGRSTSQGLGPPAKSGRLLLRPKPRKLVIKSKSYDGSFVPPACSLSAQKYFEEVSNKLREAVHFILSNDKQARISQEELYRGVENLCRYSKAQELWDICSTAMSQYIDRLVNRFMTQPVRCDNELSKFFDDVYSEWVTWSTKVTMIRNIVFYLDRSYLLPAPNLQTVWEFGVHLYYKCIIRNNDLWNLMGDGMGKELKDARSSINYPLFSLKNIFSMLSSMPNSEENLRDFLESTATDFYESFYEHNIIEFGRYVIQQTQIENNLLTQLAIPENIVEKQKLLVHKLLMKNSSSRIFPKIGILLERNEKEIFVKLYELSIEVCSDEIFRDAYQDYIIMHGTELITTADLKRTNVIASLIIFHSTCIDFSCLVDPNEITRSGLVKPMRAAFQKLLNKDYSSVLLEKLSKYTDEFLRGVHKTEVADSPEEVMEAVIRIFQYIDGKDIFENFYKKDLSKRLLQNKTASIDNEKLMVAKLKVECGGGFTSKLETMLKDMDISDTTASEFQKSSEYLTTENFSFQPHILTQGHWPTFPQVSCVVPSAMQNMLGAYEKFYLKNHSGRKVSWFHSLGNCIVKADFPSGRKELILNFFQAIILLQFNEVNKDISYLDIKKSVGIEDATLKRTLQSLACGRIKVLNKLPKKKDIGFHDMFSVNLKLKEKSFRLKINQLQAKSETQETNNVQEEVWRDRHMEIQSAIVRIMKSRKTLTHVELVQQTIEMTKGRGTLDIQEIKKDIEKLMERDFLERVNGSDSYQYIS